MQSPWALVSLHGLDMLFRSTIDGLIQNVGYDSMYFVTRPWVWQYVLFLRLFLRADDVVVVVVVAGVTRVTWVPSLVLATSANCVKTLTSATAVSALSRHTATHSCASLSQVRYWRVKQGLSPLCCCRGVGLVVLNIAHCNESHWPTFWITVTCVLRFWDNRASFSTLTQKINYGYVSSWSPFAVSDTDQPFV